MVESFIINTMNKVKQLILKKKEVLSLLLIMVLAPFLRLYKFTQIPPGLNQDEAAAAYEAYSLLLTGADRWGNNWPSYFLAWGSGQNVLYSYLSIPFIKVFGLNVFSTRLVALILGIATIPLLYLTLKKAHSAKAGLVGAFLLATLPWHIMSSRWALESNILPFFMLLGICLFVLVTKDKQPKLLIVSGIAFALSLYAYGTAVLILPLLILGLFLTNIRFVKKELPTVLCSLLIALCLALPFGLFFIKIYVTKSSLPFEDNLPFSVPMLLVDRYQQVAGGETNVLVENLKFIGTGLNEGWLPNNNYGFFPLGVVIPALFAIGLLFEIRKLVQRKEISPFFVWFVASIPLIFTVPLNLNRGNSFLLPIVGITALGAVAILEKIKNKGIQNVFLAVIVAISSLYTAFFYSDYITNYPQKAEKPFAVGLEENLKIAETVANDSERIYVTTDVPLNYIFVLFYNKVHPEDFRINSSITYTNNDIRVENYRNWYFDQESVKKNLSLNSTYLSITRKNESSCTNKTLIHQDTLWKIERCRVVGSETYVETMLSH